MARTVSPWSLLMTSLPTAAEQELIVETVEEQFSVIDHLETDLDAKLKNAQALRQANQQHGSDRARYGARLLETLSRDLSACGLRGVSVSMLERMRRLYNVYPQLASLIPSPVVTEFGDTPPIGIPSTVLTESRTARDVNHAHFEQQHPKLRHKKKD